MEKGKRTTIISCAFCGLENDKKICMSAEGMASKGCPTLSRKEVLIEAMCNPIYQAKLLHHEKSEFNILLGLCVGHDSLFPR